MRAKSLCLVLLVSISGHSSFATVLTGAGGRGVPVGSSSLIGILDYSDTFTGSADGGSNPARVYVPALQPAAAYALEGLYGHPAVNFQTDGQPAGVAAFSFAADGLGTPGLVNGSPTYPGTSGAGSATGFTQTGGNVDYGIPFGLRARYLVQIDAVASSDRIDITSGQIPGTIFQQNSLSIFFRGDGSGNASLFTVDSGGAFRDTPIRDVIPGFTTGLPNDGQWHNYAALFDNLQKTVEIFVDEQSKGVIDLTTFAGGLYQNYSNAAVGVGSGLGGGQNRTWTDNFQVGAPVPEPSSIALLGAAASGILFRRRRR